MNSVSYKLPETISPSQVSQVAATASTRQPIYVDHLLWLSPQGAKRILVALVVCFLVFEILARAIRPSYPRTAVSSLHGLRSIFQGALADPGPKIVAVGDSTLVGGGISEHSATVLGLYSKALCGKPPIYNLAVPAGNNSTSALMLNALRANGAGNVKTVIIETIPSKFFNRSDDTATIEELRRFIPSIQPQTIGEAIEPLSLSESIERQAQWDLGQLSRLYFDRDWLRTNVMGNYPVFWLAGQITPRSIMTKLSARAAQGTNRFGANEEDFPFDPSSLTRTRKVTPVLKPEQQGTYLLQAVAEAKSLGATPIILSFPLNEAAINLTPAAERDLQKTLNDYENYMRNLAKESGARLIFLRSQDFRDPGLWTRTSAHFNRQGAKKIWSLAGKELCQLHGCECATR